MAQLNLISLGISDQKGISMKGLELVKKSDFIYLENYTSKLFCSVKDLEELYGKKVIPVEREFIEDSSKILEQVTTNNVSLLIIGDLFAATTHISLYLEAKERQINVNVVHNTSILTAVGIVGLQLYKYGGVASISFHASDAPMKVIKENGNMHTLCLLDLVPKEEKFMESSEAIQRLIDKGFDPEKKVVVCAQLGSDDSTIYYMEAKNVKPLNVFPQCLIIPGDLHFLEEEALEMYGETFK